MGVVTTVLIASLFTSSGTQAIRETAEWLQKKSTKPEEDNKEINQGGEQSPPSVKHQI